MHLGLDAGNQHCIVQRPQPDGVVLKKGFAGGLGLRYVGTQNILAEVLPGINGKGATRDELACRSAPGTVRHVYTTSFGHRPLEYPVGQGLLAQGAPGVDILLDHGRHLLPPGLLP